MSASVILCLNSGSSSLKATLYRTGEGAPEKLWALNQEVKSGTTRSALESVFKKLEQKPDAVGHRFVHGGPKRFLPVRIDGDVMADLVAARELAPLHLPPQLDLVRAVQAMRPGIIQVACFDTAFHRELPEVARVYALPPELAKEGLRRYGFHGLSCEYVVQHVGAESLGRAIIAHLGSGASMTAVRDGKSQDTSMGLTPAGGLVMASRPGDLDPGVMLHLVREAGDVNAVERAVNHASGLRALSQASGDMKALLAARGTDAKAKLAVDVFCYQARKTVGQMAAALGGLDTLVFTGGVGEHAAPVREQICAGLAFLGIELDSQANTRGEARISRDGSKVSVRVVPTDEDLVVAQATQALL